MTLHIGRAMMKLIEQRLESELRFCLACLLL